MAEMSYYPTPESDSADDVARSLRDKPPADYTLKIDSFSSLVEILSKTGAKSYESQVFEVSGYKWRLSLYPNGNEERNGKGYISMYLVIEETKALPLGWEVYVNFKFFVLDQVRDKFLTMQDAFRRLRRFHELKTEWGFSQLIPVGYFRDTSNGYLIQDKCAFGAEISVIRCSGRRECLSLQKVFDAVYTWKINQYSKLVDGYKFSDAFTMGNFKWKLYLYLYGDSVAAGNSLYLSLCSVGFEASTRVWVEFVLRIRNQFGGKDEELTVRNWFTASNSSWGRSFLPSQDIKDVSKGFLVRDTLVAQVQITRMFAVQSFS